MSLLITPDKEALQKRAGEKVLPSAVAWIQNLGLLDAPSLIAFAPADRPFTEEIRSTLAPPGKHTETSEIPEDQREAIEVRSEQLEFGVRLHLTHSRMGSIVNTTSVEASITRLSLLPPLIALSLALLFRRSLPALFLGLIAASFVANHGSFPSAMSSTGGYLLGAVKGSSSLSIIVFVMGLIGTISIMNASGGIRGLVNLIGRMAKTRRGVQFATSLAGLAVFFDDYSNCVVVGTSMRPLSDKMRISREKLAYLVDSTAAPLASLTLLSTWAWFEVLLMQEPFLELGLIQEADEIFVTFWKMVPYRFYCLATLVLLFTSIWMGRDLEPMASAEARATSTGQLVGPTARPMVHSSLMEIRDSEHVPPRVLNGVLPLFSLLLVILVGCSFFPQNRDLVVAGAAILASLIAATLARSQRILTWIECVVTWSVGARAMVYALSILFLAWAVGNALSDIGTADYCVACISSGTGGVFFPILVFLVSAAVSFATGSSWSTMGLILPVSIPIACEVGASTPAGAFGLTLIASAAVLDGSIFGDHCSPLSDTTILSSTACCSDHIDHVRTQAPYAILAMIVAAGIGYLPAALGFPAWIFLPISTITLIGTMRVLGKRTP